MQDILLTTERLVDQQTILDYVVITNDYKVIYTDPDFAATTQCGAVIAHGMMSEALIMQALSRTRCLECYWTSTS
jgi:3-hydroxybutyryl-CoA dehydratase